MARPHSQVSVSKVQFWIVIWMVAASVFGAEIDPPSARAEETNSLETLRTYLQLQEQIHATQLAIEENRKQAAEATARNAEALAARLQAIEQSLASQRAHDLETVQGSNRLILLVAGTIAALGFVAMLLMAFSHWRAMNRLAEIATSLPAGAVSSARPLPALGPPETPVLALGAPEANEGLLAAIERIEKRLRELENRPPESTHVGAARNELITAPDGNHGSENSGGNDDAKKTNGHPDEIGILLGKGQSLLNLDKPEEALECFEQILTIKADHAEALVKKGSALERMRKFDDALECYDRAIAAEPTLTIAYLYKGGIFNRLERFGEALECYEKALHSQSASG